MKLQVSHIHSVEKREEIEFKIPAFYVEKSGRNDCTTRLLSLKLKNKEIIVTEILDTSLIEIKQWSLPIDVFPKRYIDNFYEKYGNLKNEITEEEYNEMKINILNKI